MKWFGHVVYYRRMKILDNMVTTKAVNGPSLRYRQCFSDHWTQYLATMEKFQKYTGPESARLPGDADHQVQHVNARGQMSPPIVHKATSLTHRAETTTKSSSTFAHVLSLPTSPAFWHMPDILLAQNCDESYPGGRRPGADSDRKATDRAPLRRRAGLCTHARGRKGNAASRV